MDTQEKEKNQMFIIGDIEGDSYELYHYQQYLQYTDGDIDLYISSNGGDVFNGLAIRSLIQDSIAKGRKVNIKIFGLVASMASIIAVSGSKVSMYKDAYLMIHNSLIDGWYQGGAKDLRKDANLLESINETGRNIYVDKILSNYPNKDKKQVEENISQLMDEETFLSASDALELGLIDEIIDLQSEQIETQIDQSVKVKAKYKRAKALRQSSQILQKFNDLKNKKLMKEQEKTKPSAFRRFINKIMGATDEQLEEALKDIENGDQAIEAQEQETKEQPIETKDQSIEDAIALLKKKGYSVNQEPEAQEQPIEDQANQTSEIEALKAQMSKMEKILMRDTNPETGKEQFQDKTRSRIKQAAKRKIRKPESWKK